MKTGQRLLFLAAGGGVWTAGWLCGHLAPSRAAAQASDARFERVVCSALTVLDPAGRPSVSLLTGEQGGVVAVFGGAGSPRVVVGGNTAGGTFVVSDREGKARAAVRVADTGGAFLTLGADGTKRSALGAGAAGGDVSIYSNDGELRGGLLVLPDGAAVSILGNDGRQRVLIAADTAGNGSVKTYDRAGRRTGGLPPSELDVR
jgi:hypothetical protein